MSREKVKTYRYKCDGMKPVTHAPDGREWGVPMVALCGTTAEFRGAGTWESDHAARAAGWDIRDGEHYCDTTHTPWHRSGAGTDQETPND